MALGEEEPPEFVHRRTRTSSLDDFTILEIECPSPEPGEAGEITIQELQPEELDSVPQSNLVVVTETADVAQTKLMNSVSQDLELAEIPKFRVTDWDGKKAYSDYIALGLKYQQSNADVVMLYESPSSSTTESSFHNKSSFKFHDWPPPKETRQKAILGPCRYSLMNGASLPAFLRGGIPPTGLLQHWSATVPGHVTPTFVPVIKENQTAYAYLPVEQIKNHVNDPHIHYHLAGKDSIHLMTNKTTRLLPDTKTARPCVVKTTHSMGSKGIFIIENDEDEQEFLTFLEESGHPTFVVTDFVDIARNVACHFFMHPDGSVVWFGSNENKREADGRFSSDSYLVLKDQQELKDLQLPFVEEVVKYCHGLGFWGFAGIDILLDSKGNGYLVDINPRVTGSCPALMTLTLLEQTYGFTVGLFRRSGHINYLGSAQTLLEAVADYNKENEGKSRIVIHSFYEPENMKGLVTRINIGVYGTDLDHCKKVLNSFAHPDPEEAQ